MSKYVKNTNSVEFTILQKEVLDNSFYELQITNNSEENYYFPIINDIKSKEWKQMFDFHVPYKSFFFTYNILVNSKNEELSFISNEFSDVLFQEEFSEIGIYWADYKQSLGIRNFTLVKSGESKIIRLPFYMRVEILKNFSFEYKDIKKNEILKMSVTYFQKDKGDDIRILGQSMVDSLSNMGFKLYPFKIESNKVPIKL